jgi:SAM-dependent methyltransferase
LFNFADHGNGISPRAMSGRTVSKAAARGAKQRSDGAGRMGRAGGAPGTGGVQMDWTGGYVADVAYTAGFYPEMTPGNMAFAALSIGRSPGRTLRPERIVELGFGQGFGLALLAAANPHIACEGYDFNPEHVANAQRLIEGAALSNLKVSEASFEEVALRGGDNDLDVITAHGIFSWVSPQSQNAILSIVRQRLQPNGLLYVSYNCMPGWAPLVPIRQFMLAVKQRHPGRSSERQLALGLDLLTKLKDANAAYFAGNPSALRHVNMLLQEDRSYLAHEYLDANWDLFQFSDMVARLAEAKLSFLCSATLGENLDSYALPKELASVASAIDDPVMRETVRDIASNKRFRRDVFARGTAPMTPAEYHRILSRLRFALAVPRKNVSFKFAVPTGEVTGIKEIHQPVADLLADKIASFDELLALPPFGPEKIGILVDCLTLLVSSGQVLPILAPTAVDKEPAWRFNRMIVENFKSGRLYANLASPVAGTGIWVSEFGLLALAAMFEGRGDDAVASATHALAVLKNSGRLPMRDGKLIEDESQGIAFLEQHLQPILEDVVPIWRRLGVL